MSLVISTLIALAGLLGVGLLVIAFQVDDWGRDLTTNVAETDPHAADTLLRPLSATLPTAEVARRVRAAAGSLPRWRFVAEESDDGTRRLEFVRTSRLFRFRDDVTVWIEGREPHVSIRARSASRVGQGDLGQNPRNLRTLMREVRARLR